MKPARRGDAIADCADGVDPFLILRAVDAVMTFAVTFWSPSAGGSGSDR
jgi:hypothetical protein